jgi:hypothetical protein
LLRGSGPANRSSQRFAPSAPASTVNVHKHVVLIFAHYAMHIHQRRQYSKRLSVVRGLPELNFLPCARTAIRSFYRHMKAI